MTGQADADRSRSVVNGAAHSAGRSVAMARILARSSVLSRTGRGGFAAVQLGFGVLSGLRRGFPFGFQAPGDQPVLRVDGAVAALGPGGGVAGLLGLAAPAGVATTSCENQQTAMSSRPCQGS